MTVVDNYVTGASGFVGQHLLKKLKGKTVSIKHGTLPNDDCENLFFLSTYGNMASHANHSEMVRANVVDPLMWIQSGLIKGLFIFMSSSSVLLSVQTPYSRTKRAAEEILQALPELKSCIVRPYSVTGVGEQKEHLIPTLIRSCMEGIPMDFDASPVHDFVDVGDVVDGLVRLADAKATGIHEFGSGWAHSNQDILECVELACGKKANIQSHRRMREYDNRDWCCKNKSPFFKYNQSVEGIIWDMVEAYRESNK